MLEIENRVQKYTHFRYNLENFCTFQTLIFIFQINLREQHSLFKNKLNPLVKKWVVTLTKSGEICDSNLLKKAIDLKATMDEVESKLKSFEKIIAHKAEVY